MACTIVWLLSLGFYQRKHHKDQVYGTGIPNIEEFPLRIINAWTTIYKNPSAIPESGLY